MSIFNLHSNSVAEYRDFGRSFFTVTEYRACELHGPVLLFVLVCGLTRDELRHLLDPADVHGPDFSDEIFRVLKEKEQAKFGEYRTRRLVLEAWDRLVVTAPATVIAAVPDISEVPLPTIPSGKRQPIDMPAIRHVVQQLWDRLVFRFTLIWEKIIVIIREKWTEGILINQERVESRFA